ncbi:DUF1127 domain-containing protein [Pseudomonas sp. DTU12.1]|uniref:DUF1127 domain-containing protein n=1 Tax=Pseudomonas TaxID=286 RepID=UPI00105E2892|nr:DUF1127 domain-containing protein [Pseudomonas sp. DTU12.1]NMZ43169.1 DUF1127 domain-containing protein [Pseudomonas proteolytica]QHG23214.1 DUF1127 domain-containing protein [Pseudomonas sp. DTU12.1]TDR41409.1 uncharacterized protein YjiS (DUF1127 family) [Pseudomonas brenneri]
MMKGRIDQGLLAKRRFAGLFQRVSRWYALQCERQLLAELSDESLKDIGLTRRDVEHERHRHSWNDPLGK